MLSLDPTKRPFIEEVIEELGLAGFDDVEVWRHTFDPPKGSEGVFLGPAPVSELAALDYWTAYILATRTSQDLAIETACSSQ